MDWSYSRQRFDTLQSPDFSSRGLLDRAENRFIWNRHLLGLLTSKSPPFMHKYCLPVTHGFVSINLVVIAGTKMLWAITSRRSIQRCGTRLFVLGSDENGFVANYIMTEPLVEVNSTVASFVLTPVVYSTSVAPACTHTRGTNPLQHWS